MSPCWAPNGKEISFISFREKNWRLRNEEHDIYRLSLKSGKIKKVKTPPGPKDSGLSFSPNGKNLAYIGHSQPYKGWGEVNY